LSHQGKKEFSSPVEPMTPEAVALHFVDDLDSKLNQLRTAREATPGILFHRGLGRYMYLPTPEANGGIEVVVEAAEESGATEVAPPDPGGLPLEEAAAETAAPPQPRLFEIG
ncbi:MAG TPA: hypothetical protein VGR07_06575, partial [Thermoanaerobaculia bacterium]|nr:hypothetical protein [Thermoanaerobaculia bacterium]